MRIRILGPLEVEDDSGLVELGGVRQRSALAYLLLHANQVVSTSQLLAALWPADDAPMTARKILQNAVWRLRGALSGNRPEGTPPELLTRNPGYMLRVTPDQVDLLVFQQRVAEGRTAMAAGDPAGARELLTGALSLWRGGVLADLVEEGTCWPELASIEKERLDVMEDWFEVELACGGHQSVLHDLKTLAEQEPLRERAAGQLMLALYRCGRQADALAVYGRLREALVDNLGLEPSPDLQRLQQAVLVQDPSLDLPAPTPTRDDRPSTPVMPQQQGPRDALDATPGPVPMLPPDTPAAHGTPPGGTERPAAAPADGRTWPGAIPSGPTPPEGTGWPGTARPDGPRRPGAAAPDTPRWPAATAPDGTDWPGAVRPDGPEGAAATSPDDAGWLGAAAPDGTEWPAATALDGVGWPGAVRPGGPEGAAATSPDDAGWLGAAAPDGPEWPAATAPDGPRWSATTAPDDAEWSGTTALDGMGWPGAVRPDGTEGAAATPPDDAGWLGAAAPDGARWPDDRGWPAATAPDGTEGAATIPPDDARRLEAASPDGTEGPAAARQDGTGRLATTPHNGAGWLAAARPDGRGRPAAAPQDGTGRPAATPPDGAEWPAATSSDGSQRPGATRPDAERPAAGRPDGTEPRPAAPHRVPGAPLPKRPAPAAEALAAAAVRRPAFPAAGGDEGRPVTVVLLRFELGAGFDGVSAESLDQTLDAVTQLARERIEAEGGVMASALGSVLLGLFEGEPQERAAAAAVRAAAVVRAGLRRASASFHLAGRGISARAAVATGPAVVRHRPDAGPTAPWIGGGLVSACEVLLAEVEPDEVRVCDTTRRLTEPGIAYRRIDGPLPAWAVEDVADGAWHDPGAATDCRDCELDLMRGMTRRSVGLALPHLLTVLGPGNRRTSLLMAFRQQLEDSPARVLAATCGPCADGWPAPAALLAAYAGISPDDLAESVRAKLDGALSGLVDDRRRRDALLDRLDPLFRPAPGPVPPEALAAEREFLVLAAAREPLVVIWDDLDRADEAALTLVEDMVCAAPGVPLLTVAGADPRLLERRPDWSAGRPQTMTISLVPSADSALERLLECLYALDRLAWAA
ncbi:BTAD domain-containing putative transcriptional regulator [Streptomyces sp. NPDC088810]|uniref:BTAD domain-containing putative transcriptional regulator n=1 Tax=Streptomyces sp. NPDC088810 TaxID=3365904 RepID=UPI003820016E